MKTLIALVLLLVSIPASALVREGQLPDYTSDGRNVKRVARVTYDIGNSSVLGSSVVDSGVHNTGVTLPKNAIITDSYLYVKTQLQSSTSGATIAFKCEDANNLFTAADITGSSAGAILSGTNYGADSSGAANMTAGIADECRIKATIATDNLKAGKVILFVEYVIGL